MREKTEAQRTIEASGIAKAYLARALGISRTSFYDKLNGKSYFTPAEIDGLMQHLHLKKSDAQKIFAQKPYKNVTKQVQ